MSTVSGLIITYLRKHPGSQNPDIRRELARHGYTTFTKKSLNQLLYSLSPDLLVWRDLPEGGRTWSAAIPEDPSVPDAGLELRSDGAWSK